jgi:excisionase family DNA binding protein
MNALLTMAEVASRLDASRPYVAMLCDAGLLGEVMTEGGRRRIHAFAVDAYLAARALHYADAPSLREAGMEAGLYDQPDSHYRSRRR